VRSAIEAAGLAYWLLMPASRLERVTRALRASLKDARDGSLVAEDERNRKAVVDRREDRVRAVAARNPIADSYARKGVTMTKLLGEVGQHAKNDVLTSWRLCAGMAHGRQWASQAMSDAQEVHRDPATGVVTSQLTARPAVRDPFIAGVGPLADTERITTEVPPAARGLRQDCQ